MDFEIIDSNKLEGKWKQQVVIARKKIIYLRIVGDGQYFRVMTATANENIWSYRICHEKERLWNAATQLARSHNCAEEASKDREGRDYIRIFTLSPPKDLSDTAFNEELYDLIDEFFILFDSMNSDNNLPGLQNSVRSETCPTQ